MNFLHKIIPNKSAAISVVPSSHSKIKDGIVVTCTAVKSGSGFAFVGFYTAEMLIKSSRKAYEKGIANAPLNVVLIELDIFNANWGLHFKQHTPNAFTLLESSRPITVETVMDNLIYDENSGIHILLAPLHCESPDKLTAEFYAEVIGHLKTKFDVVFLSTSLSECPAQLEETIFPLSDMIILVNRPRHSNISGINQWIERATSTNNSACIPEHKIHVVFNDSYQPRDKKSCESCFSQEEFTSLPFKDVTMQSLRPLVPFNGSISFNHLIESSWTGLPYFTLAERIASKRNLTLASFW